MGHSITMAALRQRIDERRKTRDSARSSRADTLGEIRRKIKEHLKDAAERRTRRRAESRHDRARRRARRREALKKRLQGWARQRSEDPLVDAIAQDRRRGAAAWRSAATTRPEGETQRGETPSTEGKRTGTLVGSSRRVSAHSRGDAG